MVGRAASLDAAGALSGGRDARHAAVPVRRVRGPRGGVRLEWRAGRPCVPHRHRSGHQTQAGAPAELELEHAQAEHGPEAVTLADNVGWSGYRLAHATLDGNEKTAEKRHTDTDTDTDRP